VYDRFDERHEFWQEYLYHGTSQLALDSILVGGLSTMGRQCIHFSLMLLREGRSAGVRAGSECVVVVSAKLAIEDGIFFGYSSKHAVVTEGGQGGLLSPQYIVRAMDLSSGRERFRSDTLLAREPAQEILEFDDAVDRIAGGRAGGRGCFARGATLTFREPSIPRPPQPRSSAAVRAETEYEKERMAAERSPPVEPGTVFVAVAGDQVSLGFLGAPHSLRLGSRVMRGTGATGLPDEVDFLFQAGFYLTGQKLGGVANRDPYALLAPEGTPPEVQRWVMKVEKKKKVHVSDNIQEARVTEEAERHGYPFPFAKVYLLGEVPYRSSDTMVLAAAPMGRPLARG